VDKTADETAGSRRKAAFAFWRILRHHAWEMENGSGNMTGQVLLLAGMVVAATGATLSRDLFAAVISLGVASASLGTVYFGLGLHYAGAFELSAGAGLITVMFVSILSMMSKKQGTGTEARSFSIWVRLLSGVAVLGIVAVMTLVILRWPPQFITNAVSPAGDADTWVLRAPDVIVLGLLILSGALGLSAMFHPEEGTRRE